MTASVYVFMDTTYAAGAAAADVIATDAGTAIVFPDLARVGIDMCARRVWRRKTILAIRRWPRCVALE